MLRREDEIMDRELKNVKQPAAAEGKSDEKDGKKDETAAGEKNEEKKEDEKKVDFDALKSLSDDGIDMSFLDSLKDKYEKDKEEEVSFGSNCCILAKSEELDWSDLLKQLKFTKKLYWMTWFMMRRICSM